MIGCYAPFGRGLQPDHSGGNPAEAPAARGGVTAAAGVETPLEWGPGYLETVDDALSYCCRSARGLRADRVCLLEVELTWICTAAVGRAAEPGSYDGCRESAAEHFRSAVVDPGASVNCRRSSGGVKVRWQRR